MTHSDLNPNLQGVPQSATLSINQRSIALQAEGRTIYRFGLGQSPFPVPEIVVTALKAHAAEKDYLPVEGLPALRRAVAEFHQRVDGVNIQPEGVLVGPGSKELMFLLQLALDAHLVVPSPCWVSYGPQARIIGRAVERIPTSFDERWRMLPEALDQHCLTNPGPNRLLILNYPGNPDGDTYTESELDALATVARKHGLIVLSDEIYSLTHHTNNHVSMARFYPEGTIISGGLSKWCGAGGWRLGTMAFPQELQWLQTAIAAAASETYTSVSAPVQYAAITAFEGGSEIDNYLAHTQRILLHLGEEITRRLQATGIAMHAPVGAFYLWLDCSAFAAKLASHGVTDSPTLCERLLADTGVAILPGAAFERPPEELTARLAYVDFDGAKAIEQSRAIGLEKPISSADLQECCGRVLDGIDALCDWLKNL